MKRQKNKLTFIICSAIVTFLTLAIFLVSNFTNEVVFALTKKGGGIYIKNNIEYLDDKAEYNVLYGSISGCTAEEGGGVYIDPNGTLNLKGKKENETSFDEFVRYDSNGEESSDGEYVYFGSYPKTVATQIELASIDTNSTDKDGYYCDDKGNRYERVTANPYSSYVFNDGITIVSGSIYYFKIEPIKWKILKEENGGVLLLCEDIIDVLPWLLSQNKNNVSNNYMFSDIRAWLNAYNQTPGFSGGESWTSDGFLKKAFTDEEQEIISTTEVDNSASTTDSLSNSYVCNNTEDKVFLLSYQDLLKNDYGFNSSASGFDIAKMKKTTDYSRAKGIWSNMESDIGYWWSRSPTYQDEMANSVSLVCESGEVKYMNVDDQTVGVVPALHIERKSKIFGNTATSGNGHNVYNAGTFTMTGGVVGTNGSPKTYGIYNTGTMNLYGGTIYDNIYSETSFSIKTSADIKGTITLGNNAIINVANYDGETILNYKINILNAYDGKQIFTFNNISTAPDLSQIEISWDDDSVFYCLKAVQGSLSTEWNVVLVKNYYISLMNQTTNFTFNEYNNGGTWQTIDRTGNGESVFTTVSTTNYGGPYIMGLTNYMVDGEKYRIFLNLKTSTTTWLQIHFEAGGKSITVNATSQYQEYFIDVTYNASSTWSSLCIYSSNWIGQTIQFKDICVKRISEFGQTYTDLPNISEKYGISDNESRAIGSWYAKFNGTSDFINFGREYMFTDKISVHLQAYSENWANVANQRLISCTETGGWNIEGNSGKIQFAGYDSGVGYKLATSSISWSSLTAGWHTFDMVFDGTYLYGYVDGVKVATSPAFSSGELGYNPTNSIFVGAEPSSDPDVPYNQYFKGYIGNVVIRNSSMLLSSDVLMKDYANISWTVPRQNIALYAFFEGSDTVLSCGHFVYDTDVVGQQIVSDGSSGHHIENTYKCSICGLQQGGFVSSDIVSHNFGTGTSYYVWASDSQHRTETKKNCSLCGYEKVTINNDNENHSLQTTTSKVKINDTQHKNVTEIYCLICHLSKTTETIENHNLTTNVETISDGISGHHTRTTISCSVCDYLNVENLAMVSHTIETVSYYTADATYHYKNTYDHCTVCSYKTDVSVGAGEKHLSKNGKCLSCGYSSDSGSILGFATVKTLSLSEDEFCLLCEVKPVIIEEEKQKHLLYFKKRYDDKKEYIAKMFEV